MTAFTQQHDGIDKLLLEITLENHSHVSVGVIPYSNLPIEIASSSSLLFDGMLEAYDDILLESYQRCGEVIKIPAGGTTLCSVMCRRGVPIHSALIKESIGSIGSISGGILFISHTSEESDSFHLTAPSLTAIELMGYMDVTMEVTRAMIRVVDSEIKLGKIKSNKKVEMEMQVQNLCDVGLSFDCIGLHQWISMTNDQDDYDVAATRVLTSDSHDSFQSIDTEELRELDMGDFPLLHGGNSPLRLSPLSLPPLRKPVPRSVYIPPRDSSCFKVRRCMLTTMCMISYCIHRLC
jgi:hypothetical protein